MRKRVKYEGFCGSLSMTKGVARKSVSEEQFVTVWVTSKSAKEAAKRLSKMANVPVSEAEVLAGVNFYKNQGVRLKAA
jgi:hypothetical protein